jgi:hypothetical protein
MNEDDLLKLKVMLQEFLAEIEYYNDGCGCCGCGGKVTNADHYNELLKFANE